MQRRRNYRKLWWWGVGVILVILIAVGIILGLNNRGENQNTKNDENETEKVEQEERVKRDEKSDNEKKDEEVAKQQQVTQYEGEDPNMAEELSGVVTYAESDGVNLVIRTSIDQYLTEGVCELTLMQGGDMIYSDVTNIVGDVSTARCEGFDVPVVELGEGNIEINIKLSAGERSGSIRGEASI